MNLTTIQQREKLTQILQDLKAAGYRAFISKREDSAYGFVEKDGNIVGIGNAPYGTGLCLNYNYKPNRKHGSGIGYGDMNLGYSYPTETDIKECIRYGAGYVLGHGVQRYQDIQEYMHHYDLYMPLD